MNILEKLALADNNGNLSLSNLGVYVAYGILAWGMYTGMTTEQLTAILTLFANYGVKRVVQSSEFKQQQAIAAQAPIQSPEPIKDHSADIAELKTAVEAIQAALSFKK